MAKSAKREKNDSNRPEFTSRKSGEGDGWLRSGNPVKLGSNPTKKIGNGGSLEGKQVGPRNAPYHDAPRAGGLKSDRKGSYGF